MSGGATSRLADANDVPGGDCACGDSTDHPIACRRTEESIGYARRVGRLHARLRRALVRRRRAWILAALLSCAAATVLAQRGFGGFGGRFVPFAIQPNAHYDGRFSWLNISGPDIPHLAFAWLFDDL